MLKLYVSYDCGITYDLDREAGEMSELEERCKELDDQMLRYYIEDEGGKMVGVSVIHQKIIAAMEALNQR